MKVLRSSAAGMRLVGGHLCLDFVNTVGGRKPNSLVLGDKLTDYSDLVAWSRHSGIITAAEAARLIAESKRNPTAARAVFRRAIALREALHHIFKAAVMESTPQSIDLETLNSELLKARNHERLISTDEGFVWRWADGDTALDRML